MLKEGDKIPAFSVVDQDGKAFTSEDLAGQRTVLYFYPKDSTPGCTAEACNLRDNIDALAAAGYRVIGVSKDSDASHRKFIEKYQLPFTLLSDKSTEMLQAFGAWGGKSARAPSGRPSSSMLKALWKGLSRKWTPRTTVPRFSDPEPHYSIRPVA